MRRLSSTGRRSVLSLAADRRAAVRFCAADGVLQPGHFPAADRLLRQRGAACARVDLSLEQGLADGSPAWTGLWDRRGGTGGQELLRPDVGRPRALGSVRTLGRRKLGMVDWPFALPRRLQYRHPDSAHLPALPGVERPALAAAEVLPAVELGAGAGRAALQSVPHGLPPVLAASGVGRGDGPRSVPAGAPSPRHSAAHAGHWPSPPTDAVLAQLRGGHRMVHPAVGASQHRRTSHRHAGADGVVDHDSLCAPSQG